MNITAMISAALVVQRSIYTEKKVLQMKFSPGHIHFLAQVEKRFFPHATRIGNNAILPPPQL
jgi:hypothetical protein